MINRVNSYSRPAYFQMLIGHISLQLKDGKSLDSILTSPYVTRRFGTVDVLKACEFVSAANHNLDLEKAADILNLEIRDNKHKKHSCKNCKTDADKANTTVDTNTDSCDESNEDDAAADICDDASEE